ncbi:2-keto-4-pentenoate hydratase [Caulobacter ginsengisoli]|uniref:2-keto-4-pentenoate hydratase n=1 Tax=Caulobacter ginsengisoli TaxID=400775 RepID=A0ABU0INT1_9CAUL|nr:2-keto-4-pentenoate hydratase [Caulobacter ginsengisoli]MDQ0463668.1 2-keto-4-pentenoate hydratase [Caulobacter ginsengisoli]
MTIPAAKAASHTSVSDIATRFVRARRAAVSLPGYPGDAPADLATGYAVQDTAIPLWGTPVVGWKVGRIMPEFHDKLGADRLGGPVFADRLWTAKAGETLAFPVIPGGFAAVEAEFIYRLGTDAPAGKTDWTPDEAVGLVETLLFGVEIAGSPLATINALGPTVVASDFGNNAGLILGGEIPGWRDRSPESMTCETFIDGALVGSGSAASLPGGPTASLAFLLGSCAARGRPLKAGDLVSTGAATGIHDITAGQSARIVFDGFGEILCLAETAKPAA